MKKNLSTKIISLLFAIFMWFYIIQVQDPEVEKTVRNVPVQFTKSELEERGLTLVNDKEVQINVKIKGQRKYITSIKKEDITVVADVGNISAAGTYAIRTNAVVSYGGIEVLEQKPSTISVTVEKIDERPMPIEVKTIGKPKAGYRIGDKTPSVEEIKVKGPESILGTIEKVCVEVDVDGADKDVRASELEIKFIGTSGDMFNPPVTTEVEKIDAMCEILKEKEVDIHAVFAEGAYVLDNASNNKITIAGTEDGVKEIKSISTEPIYAEHIKEDYAEVVFIVPEGIEIVGDDTVKLKVKKVR